MMQTISPYPWQQPLIDRQIEILRHGNFVLCASSLGTGKTITALATVKGLGDNVPYAIIAPLATHRSWKLTYEAMDMHPPLVIATLQSLQYPSSKLFKRPNQWLLPPGAVIIIDEVHQGASSAKSKTTLILAWLKKHDVKVIAQSGSIADSPLKLRLITYLADTVPWNISAFFQWARARGCHASVFHAGLEFTKGHRAKEYMAQIAKEHAHVLTRISIAEVPGFPETLITSRLVAVDEKYRKVVDAVKAELPEDLLEEKDNPLSQLIADRRRTELYKIPALKELVLEAIEEGMVPVVFVAFRASLFKLQEELTPLIDGKIGIICGGQKTKERDDTLAASDEDKLAACFCTVAGGGTGISLHARPGMRFRTSFLSPSFNASETFQALGRIARAGGMRSRQEFVMLADSIEERVHRVFLQKGLSIDTFNSTITDDDLKGIS